MIKVMFVCHYRSCGAGSKYFRHNFHVPFHFIHFFRYNCTTKKVANMVKSCYNIDKYCVGDVFAAVHGTEG